MTQEEFVKDMGNDIAVFVGGAFGGMCHLATKVTLITMVHSDSAEFVMKSLIGGFISLGLKALGDFVAYKIKKRKGREKK